MMRPHRKVYRSRIDPLPARKLFHLEPWWVSVNTAQEDEVQMGPLSVEQQGLEMVNA